MVAIMLFVAFAILADVIGLIPFAKDFTATIFWGISSFILWKKGLGMFNGKKLGAMAFSWIAGLIPIIQELPIEITGGIIAVIWLSRIEERTGVSLLKPLEGGVNRIPPARSFLNNGGRRESLPSPEDMDIKRLRNQDTQPLVVDGVRRPSQ